MLWLWPWPLLLLGYLFKVAGAAALPPRHPNFLDDHDEQRNANHDEQRNANHIFNAIHSSMRQWGSSLNHNGMSLFLAQVPAGTQFYHGTGLSQPVQGMEWLAFEPEHAINFARGHKAPGKKAPNKAPGKKPPNKAPLEGMADRPLDSIGGYEYEDPPPSSSASNVQNMLGPFPYSPDQNPVMAHVGRGRPRTRPLPERSGWLHTYRTKSQLPLLYIDGMSAGKCDKGTLDTQDILLLNVTNESDGQFWERERAQRLCQMATETWNGKIKGFIRMEAGFEVILCSFADNLDFLQAVRAGPFAAGDEVPDPDPDTDDKSLRWRPSDWIRAIAARYDGIGGGRVTLNYDSFVTAYNYDLDLFTQDDGLPRLTDAAAAVLDKIRGDVDGMVNRWDPSLTPMPAMSTDWQSIADMVVARYAKRLKYLTSGALTTSQELSAELGTFLRVFIDSDARNTTAEVDRCASQFIPAHVESPSVAVAVAVAVAARAIRSVTATICSSLFAALDSDSPFSDSMTNLRSLVEYLAWTGWERCPECPLDQVCFIPMWPFGAVEDRQSPQCRNATELNGRSGYWGNFGPGHGRHGPGPAHHGKYLDGDRDGPGE
ncbi:hypothetical protein A1O3_08959 [Capronia epimyces CBS 606.96]|uniref:Uncharacterized protein n=1 Tax=Capronia epimyces CBS 606.96 TaxID=1182542 RepID=W9XG37_9EURO|nr:uncharacterized protein A1O3_08959 [Capronia epimyces CBS 606.96]EXJ79457.1 hypothetical protein A1O3_08959 [Capronia epimyces CBS 606.96]